jgi:hypothetical protein
MPAFSKFSKFLAGSIAWVGIVSSEGDAASKTRALYDLYLDLALEVGVAYADRVQKHTDKCVMLVDISENLTNACLYHGHADLDEKQCRQRITNRPHIFTAILDACAKDVMSQVTAD